MTNPETLPIPEFYPQSENEIQTLLQDCIKKGLSVYPVSAGFNWGYGEKNPIRENSVILNLSKMNQILSFNQELGTIRIQPGVTQGDLAKYFEAHDLNYMIPNTGAGQRGSLLGNALERGFGIAPIHDHAEALLNVRGIMADGRVYESSLAEVSSLLADCFHWGVGPQLDKLVSQSSWLIVTEVTLQLEPKAECTDVLLFPIPDSELTASLLLVRDLMQKKSVHIGSVKVFHRKQVVQNQPAQLPLFVRYFGRSKYSWFFTLTLYSSKINRKTQIREIKKTFSKIKKGPVLLANYQFLSYFKAAIRLLPKGLTGNLLKMTEDLQSLVDLANGRTSEVGYKAIDSQFSPGEGHLYDFKSQSNSNQFVWLSPLCPFEKNSIEKLYNLMSTIQKKNDFDLQTFTWTVLNQRCLALVIPIKYLSSQESTFWDWYKKLHLEMKSHGFIPYRFHIHMMDFLKSELLPEHFKRVAKFEQAFDPKSQILNGRYH